MRKDDLEQKDVKIDSLLGHCFRVSKINFKYFFTADDTLLAYIRSYIRDIFSKDNDTKKAINDLPDEMLVRSSTAYFDTDHEAYITFITNDGLYHNFPYSTDVMNNLANRGLDPMKITYLLPESISESKLNSIDQRDSKAVQALRKQCFEEKLIEYQTDGINDNPVLAMIEKLRYYKQELSHANKIRQSEIEHANFKRNQEMINGKGMK